MAAAAAVLLILLPEPSRGPSRIGQRAAIVLQPNIDETRAVDCRIRAQRERELALIFDSDHVERAESPSPICWYGRKCPAPFYFDEDAGFREVATGLARAAKTSFLLEPSRT
jgi:hypothetical protein